MSIAGFSFVRNGVKNNYPFIESIQSILPICEKFYLAVGKSDDGTLEELQKLNEPKLEIIVTEWDETFFKNGEIYAQQTNIAFDSIPEKFKWCFYIQADECLHEKDLKVVEEATKKYENDQNVECLIFKYLHFYGSYKFVGNSRRWYSKEMRVIKNNKQIRSYRDAQGFRKNNKKINGKLIDASIYHYGWVKMEKDYLLKSQTFEKYYHNAERQTSNFQFDYSNADRVKLFESTHPKVMTDRIEQQQKFLNFDATKVINKMKFKNKVLQWIEDSFGIRLFEFKNYKII